MKALLTGWLLSPSASTYGPQIDQLYNLVLWITGIVFVMTEATLLYFSIRYRRKEGQKAHYSHGNVKAEIIWTAIPALILIYLGFASQKIWSQLYTPKNFPPNALAVGVKAEQWLWHISYPGDDGVLGTSDDLVVDNNFHLPVGQPVRFEMTSQDVIHGFYLPDFRVNQDTVPGMTVKVWMEPNKTGTFDLRCTQFCGLEHYQMKGQLTVETPEEFQAWLQSVKASEF